MAVRRERAIPNPRLASLRRPARRTLLLRAALGLALLGVLLTQVVVAERAQAREAPLVAPGTVGVIVLDLSASVDPAAYRVVRRTLRNAARSDEPAGLVAFSDTAYELLPPGSPARELEPLLRFFTPARGAGVTADGGFPANPWSSEFRAGTRISAGLATALAALERERVDEGTVVLVSDLDAPSSDLGAIAQALMTLRERGVGLRIVPVYPVEEKRRFFERLVGAQSFAVPPATEATADRKQGADARAPWTFLLLGGLLVALLGGNERWCGRLGVATGRPREVRA